MEFLRPNELNTYENSRMQMVLDLFGITYELLMARVSINHQFSLDSFSFPAFCRS